MDDDDGIAPVPSADPTLRPGPMAWTWLLTAVMAVLATLLAAPGWQADPGAAVPDLRWLALLPFFALAEVVVIHLPTQRNAHGHTLREIPAVLGLTFLAPQQYVSAYVLGAVLALAISARMRGVKLAFNAAMFALEAALGVAVYDAVLAGGDPLSPQGWLAVLVAVLVTDLLSAAAVTVAISVTESAFDGEVLREALRSGSVAAFINTCVALLVATLVMVQPSALPLLAVVVVLLFLAYRVYIGLARGHAQTQALYRFVGHTAAARSLEQVVEIVLTQAAELMQADRAYLVEVTDSPHLRVYALGDGSLVAEAPARPAPATWWWAALDGGVTRFERPRHHRHEPTPEPRGTTLEDVPHDGLAVQLPGSSQTRWVLVTCDRSFDKETFSEEDAQLLEALSAHAAVALERALGVSELETLASELAVARDAALAASEAKSLFLANMSHEIRTPLTTVLATAELLEDTVLDASQVTLVEKMQRQGTLLKSLVEQILDFSRIEAGEVSLASRPFDLHAMAADAAEIYAPRAADAGLDFDYRLDALVPAVVVGDHGRLYQVLTNLLDNALKFTHTGSIGLCIAPLPVDPATGTSAGVLLHVTDTGIGIAEEAHDAVFEVFNQIDGTATRRYEGTGLGLAICRQLVELMGGEITVASATGAGSTFTVALPLVAPPETGPEVPLPDTRVASTAR